MKRILSLILCLLLTVPLALAVSAEDEVISITSRQDLEKIAKAPDASYRLDADIDLGDKDWTPIPFYGKLDGNDHVLYNLKITTTGDDTAVTVDGNHKGYDSKFAGLFSVVKNAEIKNLNLIGVEIKVETDDHCFVAPLAGYIKNTHIENCYVESRCALYTTNVMVGVGGVAGFGTGEILNCRVLADLTFADRSDRESDLRCEQFMGGILACGNATINKNSVTINGYDSCYGFVHNGGLVGMHYQYNMEHPNGQICDNTVRGQITFFEKNPRRRAYCAAYGGELLTYPYKMLGNHQNFKRNEIYNPKGELPDHNCKEPDFTETAVAHKEKEWGYTLHHCNTCDYEYRTDYQAPGHAAGGWEIIKQPDYVSDGSRRQRCSVCDAILKEEMIPKRIATEVIILSEPRLSMHYKDVFEMKAHVRPKEAENQNVIWSSSDSSIVSVDQQGNITAHKRGTAEITCQAEDGFASSTCPVTVTYSPLQWVIKILLFGWIWY